MARQSERSGARLVGAGFGLERLASLYYGIDDLRRIEAMREGDLEPV